MQGGHGQAGPSLDDLPAGVLQIVFACLTTGYLFYLYDSRRLLRNRFLVAQIVEAFNLRGQRIARSLRGPAHTYFTTQQLNAVSCMIARTYEEWGSPLENPVFQSVAGLDFESRVPFPCPHFRIDTDGRFHQLPAVPLHTLFLERNAYVTGFPGNGGLQDCDELEITMCINPQGLNSRSVEIMLSRGAAHPGRITMRLGGPTPHIDLYPVLLDVIACTYIFFGDSGSSLPFDPVPVLLYQTELDIGIMPHGPGVFFTHMSTDMRERVAVLLLLWSRIVSQSLLLNREDLTEAVDAFTVLQDDD